MILIHRLYGLLLRNILLLVLLLNNLSIMNSWFNQVSIEQSNIRITCVLYNFSHIAFYPFTGKFRKFDYGLAGNIEKYDKTSPPDYNLRNITLPVYLHYATNDVLADVQVCTALIADLQLVSNFLVFLSMVLQDVLKLYKILPNAQKFLVPCDSFAHLDFVWGKDANTLLYNEIICLIERYRK